MILQKVFLHAHDEGKRKKQSDKKKIRIVNEEATMRVMSYNTLFGGHDGNDNRRFDAR